jgi:hypothetical protein
VSVDRDTDILRAALARGDYIRESARVLVALWNGTPIAWVESRIHFEIYGITMDRGNASVMARGFDGAVALPDNSPHVLVNPNLLVEGAAKPMLVLRELIGLAVLESARDAGWKQS